MTFIYPSHAALAEALQLIGQPACVCDQAGIVLAANAAMGRLFGIGGAVLAGQNLLLSFAPERRASAAEQISWLCRAHAEPMPWDSILHCHIGNAIDVRIYSKVLPDGSGVTLVFNDIANSRSDERALRRTLLEQQAILENAAVGILFLKGCMVLECNIRAAEMFGYAQNKITGRDCVQIFPSPDSCEQLQQDAAPLLLAGHAFKTELQLLHKDNGLFWCRLYVKAIDPWHPDEGTIWIVEDIDVYRIGQEKLRSTLLAQQAILDNASVGIMFTKDRVILHCNPRMDEMLGYAPGELIGTPTVEMFTSLAVYEEFGIEASALLGGGRPFEKKELQFIRRDRSQFWGRVRAKAVDPEFNTGGTIWIIEDVTDMRRDQEILRQTLMEVEAIMTNASVAIIFTKNRYITRYNRRFGEMFGFRGDAGLGMPGSSIYPSQESYDALGVKAAALLSVGKPFQAETLLRHQDGSTLWAQLIGYVVNPEETSQGTIWIIEDRTEHKRAEESLRNALLENQAILESAVIGIAVVERGYILHCNRKMEELFGYLPGGIKGVSVQAFYTSTLQWQRARGATGHDFAAGRVHTCEQLLLNKDGCAFWARLSGRPFDPAQPQGRSVWLVDDITERREAAQVVLRARDELELRVLERTAELAGANVKLQAEIVERRQAEAQVHHMAYHDSLTGLPNRSLLADRLTGGMQAAQRSGRRLAVMFIDLDRFKNINDTLGHMIGDRLLQEVANRLSLAVRVDDTVSRLGGDEFVVLAPELRSMTESALVAQKIIDALAAAFVIEGRNLHITPSIGISIYPEDGRDVETLMRHADTAMYHAKASGRNNYQFFTQEMNLNAARQFELESSLRGALARGEFVLYYQPVMDLATRKLEAMEVLLRWQPAGKELVFPDSFISILEENGLIVPVGEWVIRSACEQSMAWQRQGLPPVPLAVNLSPRQFVHRGLIASIRAILDDTGIDPALLEFEITETALMQHGEQTLDILRQINGMGIRLSIDDFGTGYSSLAYLKRFPVKKLKIDRAFIKDLEHSADDRAIVAAIIALSTSLQLSVVAEGVETEAQFGLLQDSGCQFAQGFLFSPPVPLAAVRHFLTD
jgi:diguanylate cyclase (GGDEF)-like protein/PAS domain S-box-containing protein